MGSCIFLFSPKGLNTHVEWKLGFILWGYSGWSVNLISERYQMQNSTRLYFLHGQLYFSLFPKRFKHTRRMETGFHSLGLQWPEREADLSTLSNAEQYEIMFSARTVCIFLFSPKC
jgi:hypothetical protein